MKNYDPDLSARIEKREREAREVVTFGATLADIREDTKAIVTNKDGTVDRVEGARVALEHLNNAQEMLGLRLYEQARQAINRGKWIIHEYLVERRDGKLEVIEGGNDGSTGDV